MKQTDMNSAGIIYETPAINIVDVQVEGVLCESGISIEKWENDDELLDFD